MATDAKAVPAVQATPVAASATSKPDVLPRPFVQKLETWMKEVTDLLCYQPGVPNVHKQNVIDAMIAFSKEIENTK